MSKKSFIKIAVALGALIGIIVIVFRITNNPKTPVTTDQVWDILESQGFEPVDTTQIYKEDWGENGGILNHAVSTQTDDISFDFFVFDSDESAEYVRRLYQAYIRDNRYFIPNVEIKEANSNYIFYSLKANGSYSVVIRVGNTLVFAYSNEENAEKIDNIILEMDYFAVMQSSEDETAAEATSKAASDGIFYESSEEYFDLLEGEWRAVEYAGAITDSHCDEMATEEYWKKSQEYTDEVIEENLDREFNISRENLEYFGPYSDWGCSIEDNEILFSVTRFSPGVGENISLTPPYIGVEAQLADTGEDYGFIIDAEGTVLIEIDYHFFRMERSNK